MLEVGMLHDVLGGIHDFGYTRLVVGAKQGQAVCSNHRLAFVLLHFREFRNAQDDVLFLVQDDVATVVVRDDLRLDVRSRSIRRGVDMGYETDGRNVLFHIGRNGGHHIAVFVQFGLNAKGLQLVTEHPQEVELLVGAGL